MIDWLIRELIDVASERYIDIGNAASVVGGQDKLGVAPAEGYVGMMVGGLGEGSDFVYKLKGAGEVFKFVAVFEHRAISSPAIERGERVG